ncbi:class I SAM-dependent DNA methyltransferase [Priestia abyssalis]|uniref:class I SAM-dependent DNA methyltransferase n=1 Tax=Priestia abyssalis TaxID=1221450 RepID=UPI000994AD6F|nr:class I SAM-dependent methyltransferase [Priestia abyssalis]
MNYGRFAYVYDRLMQDVPYDQWVKYIQKELSRTGIHQPKILDVACGTGQVTIRLANQGYDVTGIDLSDDMLMIAQEKAQKEGFSIPLFQQNMTELELGEFFDCVGIFCDSLNYLQSAEEVQQTFSAVSNHLKQGGLFLFDVHSPYKMDKVFAEETFAYAGDDVSYIWDCFKGEQEHSVEHELTFFVRDETGRYERFEESHQQRTFSAGVYVEWLCEAGFDDIQITADFSDHPPTNTSERLFFSAIKK